MTKKIFLSVAVAVLLISATSCKNNRNQNSANDMQINESTQDNSLFPLGDANNPDNFTGEVYLYPVVSAEEADNYYVAGSVTFMAGARTNWHTHPSTQTLIVTEGEGWYQERGKEAVKLQKGSVIPIPKDVEHWHGASAESKLVHIAVTNLKDGSAVTWMNPVTDKEYNNVN